MVFKKYINGIYYIKSLFNIVLLEKSFDVSLKLNLTIKMILYVDQRDEERTFSVIIFTIY